MPSVDEFDAVLCKSISSGGVTARRWKRQLATCDRLDFQPLNHARKEPQKTLQLTISLRRPMPPPRRNARENAAVRCLRGALLNHGGVSHRGYHTLHARRASRVTQSHLTAVRSS